MWHGRALSMIFILVVIISFILPAACLGQTDVIVLFGPSLALFPEGKSEATPDEVRFADPSIEQAVIDYGVRGIRMAAPRFDPADTLRTSRTGAPVTCADWSRAFIMSLPDSFAADGLVAFLNSHRGIVYAERYEPSVRYDVSPDDPMYVDQYQWYLENNGWHPTLGLITEDADIDAEGAWAITVGDSNITIGIIDDGVCCMHPDLGGKASGDHDANAVHGTAVAGIAAAVGNNGLDIAGIDWMARIFSQDLDVRSYLDAILGATSAGSDVINYSAPVDGGPEGYYLTHHIAVAEAYKNDIVQVATMGNDGQETIQYPAGYTRYVIAVGASNDIDDPVPTSNTGDHIDVCAPGIEITSLTAPCGTGTFDGTSMSAPIVSGIASLLLSYTDSLCNDDIENLIEIGCKDLKEETGTGIGWDERTGHGRVNAESTLTLLQPPYSLDFRFADGSCSDVTDVGNGEIRFVGVPGVNNYQSYFYHLHRVRKMIFFEKEFVVPPHVWGRGIHTTGYNRPEITPFIDDFYFGAGHTGVSDITQTSCLLTTHVYEVLNSNGGFLCWVPCEPSQVEFAFSVLGMEDLLTPSVVVTKPEGGEIYRTGETIRIEWDVNDDYPQGILCSINIDYSSGTGMWTSIVTNVSVDDEGHGEYNYHIPTSNPTRIEDHCRIRVIARDTNQHEGIDINDGDFTIIYKAKVVVGPIPSQGTSPKPNTPGKTALIAPAPNPFNPSTTIRFTIRKSSYVSLSIYDIRGAVVKSFFQARFLPAGDYTETWDGRNAAGERLASGIYFVRLIASDHVQTRKVILLE